MHGKMVPIKMSSAHFLLLLVLFATANSNENNLIVKLENGKLSGSLMKSVSGRDIYSFRGIPYAKPPIGDLRFKKPEPAGPWDGILDATQDGPGCTQIDVFTTTLAGQEDCLILNVYTPKDPSDKNSLPVMVFIHGGGFIIGSSSVALYNPERLLDHDIVLVTINYRLGVLGFLSTEDSDLPGNYGLFDQTEALKWVQKNIKKFGGNPDSVTIFGESAGGASVTYHLLSPYSKNLFHSAIIESGSPLNGWALQETPKSTAKRLALKLNCPVYTSIALKECLKTKTAAELVKTAYDIFIITSFFPMNLSPVVDKDYLPDYPSVLLEKAKINKVPTIIGVNKNEGAMTYGIFAPFFDLTSEQFLREDLSFILSLSLHGIEGNSTKVAKALVKYFYKGVDFSDKQAMRNAQIDLLSDYFITYAVEEARNLLAKAGIPLYTYIFDYRGAFSFTNLFGATENLGVAHADELLYLFNAAFSSNLQGDDRKMSDLITKLWTTFAETKNPTPTGVFPFEWKPLSSAEKPTYLELNLNPKIKTGRFTEHVDIWRKVLPPMKRASYAKKDEL